MRVLRVRLEHVRGIEACEIAFDPAGVTVVAAPNEAGKSTLVDAMRLALSDVKSRSKAQHIKDLQPVGRDVGSLIEVELRVGDHHLVVRRRYNRQPEDVVHVLAPTPRQLTGDEAHDHLGAILREHVDVDLLDALWLQQGRDLDALALGATSLSARLDAAAGGEPVGGDDLLKQVSEHYRQYFTPTGLEKAELTKLDQRVSELATQASQLESDLASVADESRELDAVESTIPPMERELAEELAPALEAAQASRQTLASVQQRRGTLEARLQQAATLRATATDSVLRRRAAADAITKMADTIDALRASLQPIADDLARLAERRKAAEQAVHQADKARRSARSQRESTQLVVDLIEARDHHHEVARRLQRARVVVEDAAEAQGTIDQMRLDEALLAQLRQADERVRVLASRADAGAPIIRLRALQNLSGEMDGEALDLTAGDNVEHVVRDRLHLRVEQLELDVTRGDVGADSDGDLTAAKRDLDDLREQAGVADMDEAESLALERRRYEETLRRRDELLERELDGMSLNDLADAEQAAGARVAQIEQRVDVDRARRGSGEGAQSLADTSTDDLEAVRRKRDETDRDAEEADKRHQQAADGLSEIIAMHDAARERYAEESGELDSLQRQIERDRAALEADQGLRSDEVLQAALAEAEEAVAVAERELAGVDEELAAIDPEKIELIAESARHARDAVADRLATLVQRRTELRVKLATVGAQGLGEQLAGLKAELERAELDQRRQRQRAEAARLLHDELHHAREEVHRAYRAPLRDQIEGMARLLVGDDVGIDLDDDLKIATRTVKGQTLEWRQLSAGAREQLAIITALAAARLAGEDGVPFILDDALGYSDPTRMATLGALLGRSEGAQVIVLTCVPDRFRTTGGRTVMLRSS
ncbi:MAG: AAA family ATPase [Nitriliruptoraceae bacterium]